MPSPKPKSPSAKAASSLSSSAMTPLTIKGYLAVRLNLPPLQEGIEDYTYFYVREHQFKQQQQKNNNKNDQQQKKKKQAGPTLFVANAPVIPGVSTKLLLESLLGRFADISRVTVIPHPAASTQDDDDDDDHKTQALTESSTWSWSPIFRHPTYFPPNLSEGKFAHVVFANRKGMKNVLKELQLCMTPNKTVLPLGLNLVDPLEIQTLADQSMRLYEKQRNQELGRLQDDDSDNPSDDNDDDDDDKKASKKKKAKSMKKEKGILAVAERYRASCYELSWDEILAECNRVMTNYEQGELAKKQAAEASKQGVPDEDGFITVTHSTTPSDGQIEAGLLEAAAQKTNSGGKSNIESKRRSRNRNKKESIGTQPLQDFYRFQRKEGKKRTLEDLRAQFEQDLKKVKTMKEDHQYRPF